MSISPGGMTKTAVLFLALLMAPACLRPQDAAREPAHPKSAAAARLPVKVDNSSTEVQVQQLIQFEKQNQIGEAFLLACEIVRQNPRAEFAYDVVIRTSLVLGLLNDTEVFYRDAIKNSLLPGKYYVQLAHFYNRTGRPDNMKKLRDEYEKRNAADADYWITMARLDAAGQNPEGVRATGERAAIRRGGQAAEFPVTLLYIRACRQLGLVSAAREAILAAPGQNFGPWELREFLLEFIKLPDNKPEDVARMIRAAMVNETYYPRARNMADVIMASAAEQRLIEPLKNHLLRLIATGKASEIEIWLAAQMARRNGNQALARDILTSAGETVSPVMAYERATALAAAGRHDEAIPILRALAAAQPDEAPVRLTLAEELLVTGNPAEAAQALSVLQPARLATAEHKHFCELNILAVTVIGDPRQIVDKWSDLAEGASFDDIQAINDILRKSLQNEKLRREMAAEIGRQLASPGAGSSPLLLLRARLCALDNNHYGELDAYEEYLRKNEQNIEMMRFVAELAVQYAAMPINIAPAQGKDGPPATLTGTSAPGVQLAISLYKRIIELQPRVVDNYSALMRVYQMHGDAEAAKKAAMGLAESATTSAETQAMAAIALDDCGFTTDALALYHKSLDLNPNNYDLWLRCAAALSAVRNFSEAESIYRELLENGLYGAPYKQPQILAGLFDAAVKSGRAPALFAYLVSRRERPMPGGAAFFLSAAKLLAQAGARDGADALLLDFLHNNPDHPNAPDCLLLRADLLRDAGDFMKAIAVYGEVKTKYAGQPAEIAAERGIGAAWRRAGDGRKAIEAWRELARRYPGNDQAKAALCDAAQAASNDLKDPKLAGELLREYLASGTQDFTAAEKARENLRRLEEGKQI
ncbi:MAG: tetratricopeptide repeat protein [Candidatus Sumerlaeota bacterium]|nr:tetratricopeptide repeat protein [Candidatus Sumerlaeota bacterium]